MFTLNNNARRCFIIIAIALLSVLLGCATSSALDSGSKDTESTPKTFDEIVATFQTPSDVEKYVHENFTYKKDKGKKDQLKSVERFMKDRGGDCEDYAYFIAVSLQRIGYNAKIMELHFKSDVGVLADKTNHSVAIFFDPRTNSWYFMEGFTESPSGSAKITGPYGDEQELIKGYFKLSKGVGDSGPSYDFQTPQTLENMYRNRPNSEFLESTPTDTTTHEPDISITPSSNTGTALDFLNKGIDYSDSKQYEKAIDCYDKALIADPNFTPAHIERGKVYYNMGRYNEAILDLTKGIGEFYASEGLYYRGLSYRKLGQKEKALADFKKACEMYEKDDSKEKEACEAYDSLK
jgi:tetratricopeptide (TPR) repeat protein